MNRPASNNEIDGVVHLLYEIGALGVGRPRGCGTHPAEIKTAIAKLVKYHIYHEQSVKRNDVEVQ